MRNHLTLILLSAGGAKVRQLTVNRWLLASAAVLLLAALGGFGFLAHGFFSLRVAVRGHAAVEASLENRDAEIAFYQEQIASFSSEINYLKGRILALDDLEKKIRTIANLEPTVQNASLFGVGGSPPEDIDATDPMKKDQAFLLREMHEQVAQLDIAAALQAENFTALFGALEDQQNLLACTPSIRPAGGWISSKFGNRRSPFTGRTEFHPGLDIADRQGSPIVATADGVVRFVGKKGLLGNLVVIDHGHGLVTRYGHLSEGLVKKGEKVKRGDLIAKMGSTGRSTGPHLHYEVRLNGLPINPSNYIID